MNPSLENNAVYDIYHQRFVLFNDQVNRLTAAVERISRLRLATVLIVVAIVIICWLLHTMPGLVVDLIVGGVVLATLVSAHHRIRSKLDRTRRLATINDRAKARLDGRWREFIDSGAEFVDDKHPYTVDLDIFGRGSLFQWLNATGTHVGRHKLAAVLSSRTFRSADALARKERITALAPLLDWRQHFQAAALEAGIYQKSPQPIIAWAENDAGLFSSAWAGYAIHILPALFLIAGVLYFFITGSYLLFIPWIPINLIILLARHKVAGRILNQFDLHEEALTVYRALLDQIEKCPSDNTSLNALKDQFKTAEGMTATRAVSALTTLTSFGQVRYNHLLSAGLNLLFLWDLQATVLLERWKRKFGGHVAGWFEGLGEFEMLSSLATIRYDHPQWSFPDLQAQPCYQAKELGHPLIDQGKRVCNDIDLARPGSVLIITGSNMSGKTTLLRTVGINLVLAFAGTPVCATSLQCAPQQLLTSMRISDDLQGGISTFYAELLRIRFILDAVMEVHSEKDLSSEASSTEASAIVLIDEIFRGTNTYDRYTAAVKVLERLANRKAMTAISTHDLDLADLAGKGHHDAFYNYHFEDHYQDNTIHFDYRLRPGKATTSNAMRLLEMVGIIQTEKEEE